MTASVLEMIKRGDAEALEVRLCADDLFEDLHAHHETEKGDTFLTWAVRHGQLAAAKLLIKWGACINQTTRDGGAPLCVASYRGRTDCVEMLLEINADVNFQNEEGVTALFIASQQGYPDIVRMLLAKGASTATAKVGDGCTPLCIACFKGNSQCTELLLANGAYVNQGRKLDHVTPLYMAAQQGHVNCIDVLLKHGVNVDQHAKDGRTPLYIACRQARVEVIKQLVASGASLHKVTDEGVSPLYIACSMDNRECVRVLLEKGAPANRCRCNGSSPLYSAAEKGYTEVVKMLLQNGAKVDLMRYDGVTPIKSACKRNHIDTVKVLSAYGAWRGSDYTDGSSKCEKIAEDHEHFELLKWLRESRFWTRMHHLEQFEPAELREMLRAGKSIYTKGMTPYSRRWETAKATPSPLERARLMQDTEVGKVVLRAAEPWSPANHELFPQKDRARATELFMLGKLLACSPRLEGTDAGALEDVWLAHIVPSAVGRDSEWPVQPDRPPGARPSERVTHGSMVRRLKGVLHLARMLRLEVRHGPAPPA